MHKSIKIVTLILLLIQIVVLSSCSIGTIVKNIAELPFYNLLISKILMISEIKPPDIPNRPSLDKLKLSLDEIIIGENFGVNVESKVNNYKADPYNNEYAKSTSLSSFEFHIPSDKLFSGLLEAVMSLRLSVNQLDIDKKEIILIDKLRNTIIVNITSYAEKNIVEVRGYKSFVGTLLYGSTLESLLNEIKNLENRINA